MSLVDKIRSEKRNRKATFSHDEDDTPCFEGLVAIGGPGLPHAPMKAEAKVLRKLKKDSGLTEEEIRKIPTYRKMLAEAQANRNAKTPKRNAKDRLIGVAVAFDGPDFPDDEVTK